MTSIIIKVEAEPTPWFWAYEDAKYARNFTPHRHRYFSSEEALACCPSDGVVLEQIECYQGAKRRASTVKQQHPTFTEP